MFPSMQTTIAHPVSVAGFGYWSGKDIRVEFRPAMVDTGIVFVRADLGPHARIAARVKNRIDMARRTNLQFGSVNVEMVEHVLAALSGLQIDNCEVWVDQAEMPGCDGSAKTFVHALDKTRLVKQGVASPLLKVTEIIRVTQGDQWVEARPITGGGCLVEYQLDYPQAPVIGRQSAKFALTPEVFRQEIAPCRTFVLEHEAMQMIQQGFGLRVTARDLLLFNDAGPVDNQLHFDNECARHKVLDLVGDLALIGCRLEGHFLAHRSGHQLNALAARTLLDRLAPKQTLQKTA
jgi:UDP-3-O-acyl N-acetylglucosamine deacetylase